MARFTWQEFICPECKTRVWVVNPTACAMCPACDKTFFLHQAGTTGRQADDNGNIITLPSFSP